MTAGILKTDIRFMEADQGEQLAYKVVRNYEEQYSIWPAERDNPVGWQDVGMRGSKEKCLEYIQEVWTDITPLSVRLARKASQGAR